MEPRTRIIDVSERRPFHTIYEAINWCVGTNYRYWGRACWPKVFPDDGFRMWFTQLAHVEHGRYVPSVNNCLNLLCCDGNYHVFDRKGPIEPENRNSHNWKYDLIFSKEVGGEYYFRGVFIGDYVHSAPNHHVSRRVATKVKLIGCPARKLELLDTVEEVEFDENYLKNQYVSYDVVYMPVESSIRLLNSYGQKQSITISAKPKKAEPPKLTDEECVKQFPVNCSIRHKTFGTGVVRSNEDGIVTIEFSNGAKKSLGVDFCVKNKLLERV